ncbi:DMT family transporter [Sphingomonas rosea]|uniref:DMT family transporter n=1 Tax=Sphingomonas rosea TaxID=335605 RepID=A0ABP7TSN2_9SPHN
MSRHRHLLPFAAAALGIALFAGMDAAMKGLSAALGAYVAMVWRQVFGVSLSAPFYLRDRQGWPGRAALRFHLMRGGVSAVMAVTWFYGLARLPMAEAIALSFIAPLIALFLAALLLKEKIGARTIGASLLGLAGVAVLVASRLGTAGERHLDGVAAILFSATLYAWNLILMRQQSQVAAPAEVTFFQSLISGGWLALGLPVLMVVAPPATLLPSGTQWPLLVLSSALTISSLALLSWAYGRAEAQALVPIEYSAFVWAALLGAVVYGEELGLSTILGGALIVAGCLLATRRVRHASPMVEGTP